MVSGPLLRCPYESEHFARTLANFLELFCFCILYVYHYKSTVDVSVVSMIIIRNTRRYIKKSLWEKEYEKYDSEHSLICINNNKKKKTFCVKNNGI